jgi:PilZ domain
MEWLKRTVDYRTLIGKRDQLGYPLGALESARLAELERFFSAPANPDLEAWAQREQERAPISLVVTFSSVQPGGGRGRARDISGDGVFIETTAPLRIGSRTVISVSDAVTGDEFRLGAEVVRIEAGERGGMGLRFVGIPLALRVGHRRATPEHRPELTKKAA